MIFNKIGFFIFIQIIQVYKLFIFRYINLNYKSKKVNINLKSI